MPTTKRLQNCSWFIKAFLSFLKFCPSASYIKEKLSFSAVTVEVHHLVHPAQEREEVETGLVARTEEGDPEHLEVEEEEAKSLQREREISSLFQRARRKTKRAGSFRSSMFFFFLLFSFFNSLGDFPATVAESLNFLQSPSRKGCGNH